MGIDIRRQGVLVVGYRGLEVLFAFLIDISSSKTFSREEECFGVPRLVPSVPSSAGIAELVAQICASTWKGEVWNSALKPDRHFPSSGFKAEVILLDRAKQVYLVKVFPINELDNRSLENKLVKAFRLPRAIVEALIEALLPVDNERFRLDLANMCNRLASVAPLIRRVSAGPLAKSVMSQEAPWYLHRSVTGVYQLEIVAAGPKNTWKRQQGCVITGDCLSRLVYSPWLGWLNSILTPFLHEWTIVDKPGQPTLKITVTPSKPIWRNYEQDEFVRGVQKLADALAM